MLTRMLSGMTSRKNYLELARLDEDKDLVKFQPGSRGFSVIVPTWNEERWLPGLLGGLQLEPSASEIIIADNSSIDSTVEIALNSNCQITAGGLPAAGRNAGARIAKEDILLFIDADVTINREIFETLVSQFNQPSTTLVYFRIIADSERAFVKAAYGAADLYVRLTAFLGTPQGSAPLICVRKAAFCEVGGFDEKMSAAEDVDFIRRVSRQIGGVRYVRSTPLRVSARRFDLEGGIRYSLKCIFWGFLRLVGLRISIVSYRWERYSI